MSAPAPVSVRRLNRCEAMGVDIEHGRTSTVPATWDVSPTREVSVREAIDHAGKLVAVVSSRLGHDAVRHREMARYLVASLQACQDEGATLLVAEGTAICTWARHAASVFGVPTLELPNSPDRDARSIAIADRVDAVHVRSNGKVMKLLRQRMELKDGWVHVAIDTVTRNLLGLGAVGRYLPKEESDAVEQASASILAADDVDWTQYLVHCTRAVNGPWPGQSGSQYRTDMMLGDAETALRDTLATLRHIVRQRRLIAGARTSNRDCPVVCFSSVPLPELLARRTYRSHLHRWDYEPFGIALARDTATTIGVMPVVYGDRETATTLPANEKFRFQSTGKTEDWTAEQEYRGLGDLDLATLAPDQVLVFVPDRATGLFIAPIAHQAGWSIVVTES
ncbi:hypothetical protein [Neorhodopirellula lusitana]|uniref:hypothetical protein n=1 Tax=Neorhodopirellula lusitana TaxID=445327 RepID=UPI00384AB390